MIGKLFENRVGLFNGLFVLLHFVMFYNIFEHVRFLLWERAPCPRLRIIVWRCSHDVVTALLKDKRDVCKNVGEASIAKRAVGAAAAQLNERLSSGDHVTQTATYLFRGLI